MSKENNLSTIAELERILQLTKSGIWTIEVEYDKQPRMYGDLSMSKLLGLSKSEIENITPEEYYTAWYSGVVEEYRELIDTTIKRILAGIMCEVVYIWKNKEGKEYFVRCGAVQNKSSASGFSLSGYHQDISQTLLTKLQQLELANLPKILEDDYYTISIFNIEDQTISFQQSTESLLSGERPTKSIEKEMWLTGYLRNIPPKDHNLCKHFFNVESVIEEFKKTKQNSIIISKQVDLSFRHTELKMYALAYEKNIVTHCIIVEKDVHDVIEKERSQQNLLQEALDRVAKTQKTLSSVIYDKLTGLYSREYFYQVGETLLKEKNFMQFMCISIDIEDFKAYNSLLGIEKGDQLITYMSTILDKLLREQEHAIYARNRADFFVVLVDAQKDKGMLPKRLEKKFMNAIQEYSHEYPIKCTFGEYLINDNNEDIRSIHDKAMHAAKLVKGKFGVNVGEYTKEVHEEVILQRKLSQDMQAGIDNKEFMVYLQPKYDVKTLKISGAEALVRWLHKHENFLSPASFIPVFEKNGFIRKLDFYIWEECCALLKEEKLTIPLSVNVSRANLYSLDLQERILKLINKYELKPDQLILEFTESAYYNDIVSIDEIIDQLRAEGLIISMDDFGSGYSSLGMLRDVSVNELKLDASFINFNEGDTKGSLILESIVDMTKKLNLHITVEGVETKEQFELIKRLGCDTVQGYYLARPMPINEFIKLYKEQEEK